MQPLIDIDVEEDGTQSEESQSSASEPVVVDSKSVSASSSEQTASTASSTEPIQQTGKYATLATPAVRRISKELNIDISFVKGTGKDGRVLKEDVLAFHASGGKTPALSSPSSSSSTNTQPTAPQPTQQLQQQQPLLEEKVVPLTPIQNQMFKTMTNSLNIPHFLYTEEVSIDSLTQTRKKINSLLAKKAFGPDLPTKISYMPFFIKALSLALTEYPIVNSKVVFDPQTNKPQLVMRPSHNVGIAMDTPSGLVVPNIKNVERLSILEIASELSRLQQLGAANKFSSQDLQGGTVSLSNIGNVGGTYLGPVIVDSQVAIVGIGRARTIPSFAVDEVTGAADFGKVVPRQVINTSWSGDHRVLDGMTMAKMADRFKEYLESPELMMLNLK